MGFEAFFIELRLHDSSERLQAISRLKMVFVVNHALKMGKGKIAAQVGHAAVKATLKSGEVRPELLDAWLSTGQKKICVKANDSSHIEEIEKKANQQDSLCKNQRRRSYADPIRLTYGSRFRS